MYNLANTLRDKAKYDEAEALYKKTLSKQIKVLGETHTCTLDTTHNLANTYKIQGKTGELNRFILLNSNAFMKICDRQK